MKHTQYIAVAVILIMVALAFGFKNIEAGSVGAAYTYKHYTSANASSTAGTVVKGGYGELGMITINSATSTGKIKIYDGATTATSGMPVIAVLDATTPVGTYTYEVSVTQGVVAEMPAGFVGDITFSVR